MRKTLLSVIGFALLVSCSTLITCHDENRAANKAILFAKVTLLQHNLKDGYLFLSDNFKEKFTFEKFSQLISELHPSLYPLWITAEGFGPIPGQKAMNIFLHGENGLEKFYYRFVMEGTSGTGYTVSGIFRSKKPYLESKLKRKLRRPIST